MFELNRRLRWSTASGDDAAMLNDLQGNILNGHGRRSTKILFLRFTDDQVAARAFVRALAPHVKSAMESLIESRHFKRDKTASGTPFIGVMLSASGYAALGVPGKAPHVEDGDAFASGMLARASLLNDDPAGIEPPYRSELHAMILIGGDPVSDTAWTSDAVDGIETMVVAMMQGAATVVQTETGRAIFKTVGTAISGASVSEGIEHFGYVDGRSQPLMLEEAIDDEPFSGADTGWDPRFDLAQVLVSDPGSTSPTAFGSYFVFRKLEQNVDGFKTIEAMIGTDLGLGELAGAMLVGRFEDGTPVEQFGSEQGAHPVPNDFNYATDPDGIRCPLHAHIRKVNPRGDTVREFPGATLTAERSHIMARRGMPFGTRDSVLDPTDRPSAGVGLLFMAFQANIRTQFEFTQARWANNPGFLRGVPVPTGRDPIIGQHFGLDRATIAMPPKWNDATAARVPLGLTEFVHHRGGGYFFAPARSTLASM